MTANKTASKSTPTILLSQGIFGKAIQRLVTRRRRLGVGDEQKSPGLWLVPIGREKLKQLCNFFDAVFKVATLGLFRENSFPFLDGVLIVALFEMNEGQIFEN